ncbi:DUF6171 family protein [Alkalihalobacillus sp. NPDC078783]
MACVGCLLKEEMKNLSVETLVNEQLAYETDVVDERDYQIRLSICEQCPSLQANTTCKHCGCFVGYRAKLAYKSCPYPGEDRWSALAD